jgi:uncharacterized protein (TIGR00661 family)
MARILYGVCGEGMGHALRTVAIIEHLQKDHEIIILSSFRAYKFLKAKFNNVHEIHGFHIEYKQNEVDSFASFISNTAVLPKGLVKSIKMLNKLVNDFNPEICISDFEPYTCHTARTMKIPCIAIDNINVLTRTKIEFDKKYLSDFILAQSVSNFMTPYADYFLLSTFFFPEIKSANTFLFPPIIRKDIIDSKTKYKDIRHDHILVYQTSKTNTYLFELLKNVNETFIIYGVENEKNDDNLIYKPFGDKNFCEDFAASKGVITNGGYSFISEAIYLEKPILSEPVGNQFEQIMNGTYIEKLGFGLFTEKISFADIIKFLTNLDFYQKHMSKLKFDENRKLFNKLDIMINDFIIHNQVV